jgi:hypothetical protein
MKRIGMLVLLLVFGFAIVASAQKPDLGELAKKEKARREALEKSGKKTKVLTNEDVSKIKSQLGMVSGSQGEEGQPPPDDSTYTPPVEGEDYVPAQQPEQTPPDPNSEAQKQRTEIQNQIDEQQKAADDARANVGAGGLWHSHNTGDQYKKAYEAEKKVDELNDKREKIDSGQQQSQQPPPEQPAPEEYVPPSDEATEEPPAEEPPAEEPPLQI